MYLENQEKKYVLVTQIFKMSKIKIQYYSNI